MVGNLKIKMDPRAVMSDLLVDVGVALGRSEAAKLGVSRPLIAERPAQRGRPEGGRLLRHVRGYVNEDVQPLRLLSQERLRTIDTVLMDIWAYGYWAMDMWADE
jgi:hypothetical protein